MIDDQDQKTLRDIEKTLSILRERAGARGFDMLAYYLEVAMQEAADLMTRKPQ